MCWVQSRPKVAITNIAHAIDFRHKLWSGLSLLRCCATDRASGLHIYLITFMFLEASMALRRNFIVLKLFYFAYF